MKNPIINITSKTIEELNLTGSGRVYHMGGKYKDLLLHPRIAECEPKSRYGECHFCKYDGMDYYSWCAPIANGGYRDVNPIFHIVWEEA